MFKTEYVLPSPLEILHTILFSGGWVVLPLLPRPAAVGGMNALCMVPLSQILNPAVPHKSYS